MPQNTTKLPKASNLGLSAAARAKLFASKQSSRRESRAFRTRVTAFTAQEIQRLRMESEARTREALALESWLHRSR